MRKLAIPVAVLVTLGLAATAGAALPQKGAFAGTTLLRTINGFPDLVKAQPGTPSSLGFNG